MSTMSQSRRRSPWREPMVWLVVAIPVASVIAGVGLLAIAIRAGGSDAIADPVKRISQIQTADLSADARASQLGLAALARSDAGMVRVLPVSGVFARAQALRLTLRHPTRAAQDRRYTLQPGRHGWQIHTALDLGHDWNVELTPVDRQWRLQGRWKAGERAAHLWPVLAAR